MQVALLVLGSIGCQIQNRLEGRLPLRDERHLTACLILLPTSLLQALPGASLLQFGDRTMQSRSLATGREAAGMPASVLARRAVSTRRVITSWCSWLSYPMA